KLDREYESGSVGAVVVLEHLGAREYGPVPRRDGPGDRLAPTGRPTLQQIFVTPSKPLVTTVESVVSQHDLERTIIMKGADVPGETAPEFCNFGGEGTPFNQRLLPTVGIISAPQTLYDPAFGMEGVDIGLMRRQMVAFTDLVTRMGRLDHTDLAGSVPADRARRAAGAPECPT
ncbi:MAG TPA: hypothetical protein VFN21_07275, partial [Acidimicrobiales bacterium]|nr:hypothetical protein [Acidimicrobiales bacterium]